MKPISQNQKTNSHKNQKDDLQDCLSFACLQFYKQNINITFTYM